MNLPLAPMAQSVLVQQDAQLIWELTADITPRSQVLQRYGLTISDFRNKLKDKMFRAALREAQKLWDSDLNVKQRVQLKAAFLVEDSLLDLMNMIKDPAMPPQAKLEAFKKLAEVSQLAAQNKGDPVETHKIVINVGAAPVTIATETKRVGQTYDAA